MDLTVFQMIWIASASVLFVGWLVVSFTPPSGRRTIIEWISASAMYLGLLTFFISIGLNARASGNTILLIAMGLLCAMFGGGLLVSLGKIITALGSGEKSESSATN
jgi:hypothetical protein